MKVVIVLTIEATKHNNSVRTDLYTSQPSPRIWLRVANVDFFPFHLLQIEAVEVIHIILVTATDD